MKFAAERITLSDEERMARQFSQRFRGTYLPSDNSSYWSTHDFHVTSITKGYDPDYLAAVCRWARQVATQ